MQASGEAQWGWRRQRRRLRRQRTRPGPDLWGLPAPPQSHLGRHIGVIELPGEVPHHCARHGRPRDGQRQRLGAGCVHGLKHGRKGRPTPTGGRGRITSAAHRSRGLASGAHCLWSRCRNAEHNRKGTRPWLPQDSKTGGGWCRLGRWPPPDRFRRRKARTRGPPGSHNSRPQADGRPMPHKLRP